MCSTCKPAFAFELTASAKLARRALSSAAGFDLDSWDGVVSSYRSAKSTLISALDAETGRRSIPVEWEDVPAAWGRFKGAIADIAPVFYAAVQEEDFVSNKVGKASPLLGIGCKDIRPEMKLTRALGAYFRAQGLSNDDASAAVDKVSAASVRAVKGTLVISANIADLLLCSECCSYTSCHRLEGQYRAGPQQYIHDPHTIVAYYHKATEAFHGERMPKKLFRQIIHVDARKSSAVMMRVYGRELPEPVALILRREVARLLIRLAGRPDSADPKWVSTASRTKLDALDIHQSLELAYIDAPSRLVQLTGGLAHRPEIVLADSVPCPECGEKLDDSGSLVCKDCGENTTCCSSCGERVRDDDCHSDDDGSTYCDSCYGDRFTSCHGCDREMGRDDAETIDGEDYCGRCIRNNFTRCTECEEYTPDEDVCTIDGREGSWCESCHADLTSSCDHCGDTYHDEDLTAHNDESLCAGCLEATQEAETTEEEGVMA